MKQIIFAAMFFAVALASVFVACNKENVEPASTVQPKNAVQITDAEVEARILNFKQRLTKKSTVESFDIDSAVWYIEALLNYSHCVIFDSVEILTNSKTVDSVLISFPATNGIVLMEKIQENYPILEEFALNALTNVKSDHKHILLIDIEYLIENSQLALYLLIQYYDESLDSGKSTNQEGGDWIWGREFGSCDGTGAPRDATNEIEDYIREFYPRANPDLYPNTYYTGIFTSFIAYGGVNPWTFYEITPGNTYDLPEPCLSEAQIQTYANFYLSRIEYYNDYFRPKIVFQVSIDYSGGYFFAIDSTQKWHTNIVWIGAAYKKDTPPFSGGD